MGTLTPPDLALLQSAVQKLETQSLAMKIAASIGIPIERVLHMLPAGAQASVGKAVNRALEQCLRAALQVSRSRPALIRQKHAHTVAVAVTGAIGGFFGLPGMLVELPVTTTVMLHSIVEIARRNGEDLANPETALACLAVFALGPQGVSGEAIESAYYVTRAALAQVTREAALHLAQKGTARETAPVLISFLARIASRFGLEVSEKAAAELVPIAGAAGGLALNVLFNNHFQGIAEGHFTVRRLERQYGHDAVREAYETLRPRALA
jgi:hypothetical protein